MGLDYEPEQLECIVLQRFKDPLTCQVAESLNTAGSSIVLELSSSKAEYHQLRIVRVLKQVQMGPLSLTLKPYVF